MTRSGYLRGYMAKSAQGWLADAGDWYRNALGKMTEDGGRKAVKALENSVGLLPGNPLTKNMLTRNLGVPSLSDMYGGLPRGYDKWRGVPNYRQSPQHEPPPYKWFGDVWGAITAPKGTFGEVRETVADYTKPPEPDRTEPPGPPREQWSEKQLDAKIGPSGGKSAPGSTDFTERIKN
jgi:hypothetical protein